ncbi:sensor histidine kinase [Streptacidiphilus cavernicola]|uniref:Sensor-like histidine kinase SenX3 n=1 Tax=Streptacidiphilus cavernicola TaxID=3342716 RepID=A0ABV6W271_9ACTN
MDVNVAEAAASALAGLGVGLTAALSFRWSEKDRKKSAKRIDVQPEPELPPGVDTVLSVLRSCAVVLDDSDQVIKASSAAYALGLVRGGAIAVDEMLAMARQTRRDGEIRQADLDIPRGGGKIHGDALAVSVRVAPLGSRLVLVLVEDLTEARRIEAVRRDFVANVSHELKTPVGALSLLSEAVQDASDDPEAVRRFAGRMLIEATRLTSLVQEIIELSRVQDDERLTDSEPVAVDELVAEAMDRCRHQAAAKQITMAAGGIAGLSLHGNRGQLAAALGNLVENAVNYSPARTRVAIAARKVPGTKVETVEISVTDQGTGISERDRERIFERFYRVDPARSRATGGTGLGLSIVKHVAASHGGTVSVWSVEGQGSTFTLRLPTTPRGDSGRERGPFAAPLADPDERHDTADGSTPEPVDGSTPDPGAGSTPEPGAVPDHLPAHSPVPEAQS